MLDGSTFIECECGSDEHTLRYTIDAEDGTIYTSVFLNQWNPWYKRIWIAIKYIFGYKCKYGHFDCTLMGEEQVRQLRKMIYDYEGLCLELKAKKFTTWTCPICLRMKPLSEIECDHGCKNSTAVWKRHEA